MTIPIENIPVNSQETLIIKVKSVYIVLRRLYYLVIFLWQDLLNILGGLCGSLIEPQKLKDPYSLREFKINYNVEPSLAELVKQILPLAAHYSIVLRFIEEKMRFEYGQVCNALAEAMNTLVIDYMV